MKIDSNQQNYVNNRARQLLLNKTFVNWKKETGNAGDTLFDSSTIVQLTNASSSFTVVAMAMKTTLLQLTTVLSVAQLQKQLTKELLHLQRSFANKTQRLGCVEDTLRNIFIMPQLVNVKNSFMEVFINYNYTNFL